MCVPRGGYTHCFFTPNADAQSPRIAMRGLSTVPTPSPHTPRVRPPTSSGQVIHNRSPSSYGYTSRPPQMPKRSDFFDPVEAAAQELGFDPQTSFVIGDKVCDIELGQRVGATTFLVRTGYGAQVATENTVAPDYVVDGLWDAALIIERLLAGEKKVAKDAPMC